MLELEECFLRFTDGFIRFSKFLFGFSLQALIIHIFKSLKKPFCDGSSYLSGSQSGQNRPLGAILRGKGANKKRGTIGGKNKTKGAKTLKRYH